MLLQSSKRSSACSASISFWITSREYSPSSAPKREKRWIRSLQPCFCRLSRLLKLRSLGNCGQSSCIGIRSTPNHRLRSVPLGGRALSRPFGAEILPQETWTRRAAAGALASVEASVARMVGAVRHVHRSRSGSGREAGFGAISSKPWFVSSDTSSRKISDARVKYPSISSIAVEGYARCRLPMKGEALPLEPRVVPETSSPGFSCVDGC